jgi:hypothetical protein
MQLTSIGELIAKRELDLAGQGKVTVLIGMPKKCADDDDYYCPYQIVGIGNERVRYAVGVDEVQALQLVQKMIGTDLYTSKEAASGALDWKGGDKGDLGFPVPDVLRDLAPNA